MQDVQAIGKKQNYGIPDMLFNSREEYYCSNNRLCEYKGATMYGRTSVRWIVHTLTPNRTYERQPLSGTFN